MNNKSKAMIAGVSEAAIEAIKLLPGAGSLIEGVRKYHHHIEEQQREEFVRLLSERLEKIEEDLEWYSTESGERFVRKTFATALNAEYADKLEFLANALVNGPSLGNDDAHRLKFIEMIRSLSRPALNVLVASLNHPIKTDQIIIEELATYMKWPPHLVDACVAELRSYGAYSSVISWNVGRDGTVSKSQYLDGNGCAKTSLTRRFAQFIAEQ